MIFEIQTPRELSVRRKNSILFFSFFLLYSILLFLDFSRRIVSSAFRVNKFLALVERLWRFCGSFTFHGNWTFHEYITNWRRTWPNRARLEASSSPLLLPSRYLFSHLAYLLFPFHPFFLPQRQTFTFDKQSSRARSSCRERKDGLGGEGRQETVEELCRGAEVRKPVIVCFSSRR